MSQKRSTNELARNLPVWLREWAQECLQRAESAPPYDDICHFPVLELDGFWRMLSAKDVADDLTALSNADNGERGQRLVRELLVGTCQIFNCSKLLLNKTPSGAVKELQAIAKSSRRLAKSISDQGRLLEATMNLRYLAERVKSGESAEFVRKRIGLRHAIYAVHSEDISLVQVLNAFAADILEEYFIFPDKFKHLDGGADAAIRFQMNFLKRTYCNLFGKANNAIIARLLTAINGVDVEASRVAKVKF